MYVCPLAFLKNHMSKHDEVFAHVNHDSGSVFCEDGRIHYVLTSWCQGSRIKDVVMFGPFCQVAVLGAKSSVPIALFI